MESERDVGFRMSTRGKGNLRNNNKRQRKDGEIKKHRVWGCDVCVLRMRWWEGEELNYVGNFNK